jgi:hypothetical protein
MIISTDALTGIFLYGLSGKVKNFIAHLSQRNWWLRSPQGAQETPPGPAFTKMD